MIWTSWSANLTFAIYLFMLSCYPTSITCVGICSSPVVILNQLSHLNSSQHFDEPCLSRFSSLINLETAWFHWIVVTYDHLDCNGHLGRALSANTPVSLPLSLVETEQTRLLIGRDPVASPAAAAAAASAACSSGKRKLRLGTTSWIPPAENNPKSAWLQICLPTSKTPQRLRLMLNVATKQKRQFNQDKEKRRQVNNSQRHGKG